MYYTYRPKFPTWLRGGIMLDFKNMTELQYFINVLEDVVYNEGQSFSDKLEDIKELIRIHKEK